MRQTYVGSSQREGSVCPLPHSENTRSQALVEESVERRSRADGKSRIAAIREVEVLRLVAQGLTDAQVAEQLVISPRTVNWHLSVIYSKLGVSSRSAATRFALEQKLV